MQKSDHAIKLSVIVATVTPWPGARLAIDSLEKQAMREDVEIILVDGSGQGMPSNGSHHPWIRWIKQEGLTLFQLRALGLQQAHGNIIALTEDHCRVSDDWCDQILKAHEEYTEAAAIGGAVENGSTERPLDWANFLMGHARFMLPLRSGNASLISGSANLSYKRWALPESYPIYGFVDVLYHEKLRREGKLLVMTGQPIVEHIQSYAFSITCKVNFHNGRSTASFRLFEMGLGERLFRLITCPLLPAAILTVRIRAVITKRTCLEPSVMCIPFLMLLACCHTMGELTGYIAGPGSSPRLLGALASPDTRTLGH